METRVLLPADFYRMRAPEAAPLLLGKLLCRRMEDGRILRAPITETECYFGESDTACHAHRGRTPRTRTLYEEGGIAYVYLCYGIHSLLNVVTGPRDFPEAVLIRGIRGAEGPGRLTRALAIDRTFNGLPLTGESALWIEDAPPVADYTASPRIGIGYASEEDQKRLWRFTVRASI